MRSYRDAGLVLVLTIFFSFSIHAADKYFFADGFEGNNLSAETHPKFYWETNNSTSIVTNLPQARVLWGSKSGSAVGSKDWGARLGNNALRAHYAKGEDSWAEQRFHFGQGLNEVWIKFDLRVPTNFEHKDKNRKIFYLWMDGYGSKGKGATVGWEYWPSPGGISALAVNIQSHNDTYRHTGHIQHFDFINPNTDKGRWMSVIFYLKVSSTASSSDGVVAFYRKWDDENNYTRYHYVTDAILPAGLGDFQHGYLMGWHNGSYSKENDWLIDNFIVSEENLITRRPKMED